MSGLLEYLYTVLTRIWDIISYPFDAIAQAVQFVNGAWHYVSDISDLMPAWIVGSIALVFALGIVLFILER